MSKKQNIKKLLELNDLVNKNGDIIRIKELRHELGIKMEEEINQEEVELRKYLNSYIRMRALGLWDNEIAFSLCIGTAKVGKLRDIVESEGLGERIEMYKETKIVKRYESVCYKRRVKNKI